MIEELKVIIKAETDKFKKAMEDSKKEATSFSEQVKKAGADVDKHIGSMGKGVAVGLGGLATALVGVSVATQESRNEAALLKTAFESAGGTAEQATQTYNDLYRVLGDGGQATEAAQHLAKLGVGQKELSEYTEICKGVYGEFSASLPLEGLTEAINHTVKLGEVQGPLADALEWSGISTDSFNESLAKCNTEGEREKLIRETLTGIYAESAETYEKNNADILAQRDAQLQLEEGMNTLGAAVAPVLTALTTMGAELLNMALALTENKALMITLATVIGIVATAIGLYNAVAAVKAAMAAAEVTSVWGLVAAYAAQAVAVTAALAPYLLIAAAIAALIAVIVLCVKHWDKIKEAGQKAWELIKKAWEKAAEWFGDVWEKIKKVFSVVADWFKDIFSKAWNGIKTAWGAVKEWFSNLWNGIKNVFSAVGSWFSGIFQNAWNGIKNAFSAVKGFFSGVWETIKGIFSNVGNAIAGGIKGAVSGAVNAVLSTACKIINGFISAINFAIGIINAIPGVNIGKLKQLSVPKMARGGIVDTATLAMIGENGREAVMPLENNLGWLDKLAEMLNARMGGNMPIVLQVDGKTFAQISVDSINQLTKQTGALPLVLG